MTAVRTTPAAGAKFYRLAWIFYLVLAIAGLLWLGAQRGRLGLELFVDPGGWWIDVGAGVALGGALVIAATGAVIVGAARRESALLEAVEGPR